MRLVRTIVHSIYIYTHKNIYSYTCLQIIYIYICLCRDYVVCYNLQSIPSATLRRAAGRGIGPKSSNPNRTNPSISDLRCRDTKPASGSRNASGGLAHWILALRRVTGLQIDIEISHMLQQKQAIYQRSLLWHLELGSSTKARDNELVVLGAPSPTPKRQT